MAGKTDMQPELTKKVEEIELNQKNVQVFIDDFKKLFKNTIDKDEEMNFNILKQ